MTFKGGAIVRSDEKIGLKQMFDEDSNTYTYLLWDEKTRDAVLVDPVDLQVDRDLAAIEELGLNLVYGIETHAHADHITGAYLLKQRAKQVQSVIAEASGAEADVKVNQGDRILFGTRFLEVRATPGHTVGCLCYVADDKSFVLTGDALLIQGCGRTDFQGGSAADLYDSIHTQLFSLPDSTVVYPGHDYKGQTQSSIGEEKESNPRLGGGKSREEFIEIMANLNLPHPKKIDLAVPANLRGGAPAEAE
jgi:sulfur dioxygenase